MKVWWLKVKIRPRWANSLRAHTDERVSGRVWRREPARCKRLRRHFARQPQPNVDAAVWSWTCLFACWHRNIGSNLACSWKTSISVQFNLLQINWSIICNLNLNWLELNLNVIHLYVLACFISLSLLYYTAQLNKCHVIKISYIYIYIYIYILYIVYLYTYIHNF